MNTAVKHILEIAEETGIEFPITETLYIKNGVEVFVEHTRMYKPYGAFKFGIGTFYGETPEDAYNKLMEGQVL